MRNDIKANPRIVIVNFIDETMFYDAIDPSKDTSTKENVEAKSTYVTSNR